MTTLDFINDIRNDTENAAGYTLYFGELFEIDFEENNFDAFEISNKIFKKYKNDDAMFYRNREDILNDDSAEFFKESSFDEIDLKDYKTREQRTLKLIEIEDDEYLCYDNFFCGLGDGEYDLEMLGEIIIDIDFENLKIEEMKIILSFYDGGLSGSGFINLCIKKRF